MLTTLAAICSVEFGGILDGLLGLVLNLTQSQWTNDDRERPMQVRRSIVKLELKIDISRRLVASARQLLIR